ncbi:hypothetical protein Bca4012_037236 [Brassica carinata]
MSIVARNVQAYVPINLLEPSSETQKICMMINNRWTMYSSKSGNSIELVLVNLSSTGLHTSIENDLVQKHRHLLNEGQAISINAFSLKEYGDGEDCSESFYAEIQTPNSKNDNQAVIFEDQRSVSKRIKVERKK